MATDMTTKDLRAQVIDALTDDGDEWWSDDERHGYRLTIETDDVPAVDQINDCDCYGRVAWAEIDRDTGHYRRPDGFTGAARLLRPNGWHMDSPVWWEPYREGHKVADGPDEVRAMTRLLSDGFQMVTVTKLARRQPHVEHYPSGVSYCSDCRLRLVLMDDDTHGPTDCDGSVVEGESASLSGIDSLEGGYLAMVVGELVDELTTDDATD